MYSLTARTRLRISDMFVGVPVLPCVAVARGGSNARGVGRWNKEGGLTGTNRAVEGTPTQACSAEMLLIVLKLRILSWWSESASTEFETEVVASSSLPRR